MNQEDLIVLETMESAHEFMVALEEAKMLRGMSREEAKAAADARRLKTGWAIRDKYGDDAYDKFREKHDNRGFAVKHPSKKQLEKHQSKGVSRKDVPEAKKGHAYLHHNDKVYNELDRKYDYYKD